MRVGVTLPHEPLPQPNNLSKRQKQPNNCYDTLWVTDRLLYRVNDHAGYLSNGRLRVGFGLGWSVGADRSIFAGSLDQVRNDIDAVKKPTPTKFDFYDPGFSRGDGTVPQFGVTN